MGNDPGHDHAPSGCLQGGWGWGTACACAQLGLTANPIPGANTWQPIIVGMPSDSTSMIILS